MVRSGLSIRTAVSRLPGPRQGARSALSDLPAAFLVAIIAATALPGSGGSQGLDRDSWSVDQTWTGTRDIEFDVTEGTWMNLDVSPDGRLIVFDMLGDLYTMPIGGGRAARITGGPAFDFQPRFSPDGRRIAFVSDRDGLNNIWTVAIDGSDPQQVTDEAVRDVNSPAWSPDGEYIFVRKHFVFSRSLGAGEIWMYHRTGGSGMQVTDRPNEQQDQGEPAVSADGEWLYYSQDVTPGPLFQYNKDPYPGIYAIRRRNLENGEEETVSRGPGGSITPTPHPDGRRLAFVRRVRTNTVLFIRDLETGEEWPVWDGLERDMQEAWAIHGVYTDFDWVPGTDHIVIWAQGKIWRIDTASGLATEIPFSAAVDQRVQAAVRHAVDVGGEEFDVKMLRNVHTSPNGRRVTFSAMGRIWVKEMPNGTPERLTTAEDIEAFPRFSPDGRRIAYVSWDDEEKGRVRVVSASGGEGVDIVGRPGHFVEPSWSPNGRWVVFRSVGGDSRRGPTHGEDRGIFVAPADGAGAPWKVREGGSAPAYSADGNRIFFTEGSQAGVRLMSSDINGQEEITHLTASDVTEWAVSPDGKWIAFVEGWRTFIAPFPSPGRPVAISKDSKSYPVAQASRWAGAYLHWSGDGNRLHWSQGPNYYTRELAETFSFVQGGAEPPAEPESEGVPIGFRAFADVPSGIVAFVGGRIITSAVDPSAHGAVDGVIENGVVVVSGNRITAVGPANRVNVPAGAHRVDARGKTLMPGIIDAHAHVGSAGGGLPAEADWPLLANLAFGVTTSHDPSNSTEMVFTASEMIRAGLKLGPRLLSTGTILYGAETPFRSEVSNYQDALMHVRRQKAAGAPSVKSYNQRRRDARQWILQAADAEGVNVVPEGGSTLFQNLAQIIDGHTTIEHNLPPATLYQDVIGLWAGTEVAYTPTLIVGYGGLSGEYYFYDRYDVWTNDRLMRFTPRSVVDPRSRRRLKAAGDEDYNHIALSRHVNELNKVGVLTNVGAHGQLQGLGAHWELWMFVQGGMSEMDAIRSATINPARSLGLSGDLGSIEEGKLADLLVLNGNPLEDIHESESIGLVMVNGRLYDAMTLFETGNYSKPRPTLWFERTPPMAPGGASAGAVAPTGASGTIGAPGSVGSR